MICTQGKGGFNIRFQIIIGLSGQGKDKVHGNGFKGNGGQRRQHFVGIKLLSAKKLLILVAEGLNTNADFCYTCILQCLQHRHIHIIGMKLYANPLCDYEVLLQCSNNFFYPMSRKRRCPSAEIEGGYFFPFCVLAPYKMDFLYQRVYICITQFGGIPHFAIGAKVANALAKGDMHI